MENLNNQKLNDEGKMSEIRSGQKSLSQKIISFAKWFTIVILSVFIVSLILRSIQLRQIEKTERQVEIIHASRITMDDVMGEKLPPDPGEEGNKTVVGIDANKNGIRDDVELAIFKEYPNSAKTRAALLQYARVGQMILAQSFVNTIIATEVIREHGRADSCIADSLFPRISQESPRDYSDLEKIDTYEDFIDNIQFNTQERIKTKIAFYKKVRSFSDLNGTCDITTSQLLD